VTGVNEDTALFAGIVHEVGGFYLLSRAEEFPACWTRIRKTGTRPARKSSRAK
jgi:hypothetical protein